MFNGCPSAKSEVGQPQQAASARKVRRAFSDSTLNFLSYPKQTMLSKDTL